MKNKFPTTLVSIFFILAIVLNACASKAEAAVPSPAPIVETVPVSAAVAATATATATTAAPSNLSAILSEVTGRVEIKPTEQDAFISAELNSFLNENGQALTGNDGRARFDLSTGTIVRLAPDSLFTLTANEVVDGSLKTRFQLAVGKLFVILNGGSLEVETPTGTAAVRGSYMSVDYDTASGEVRVTCLEGHCSLSSAAGTVEITAGQTAVISGIGQPPQVGEMSDEDIQAWLDNNPEAWVMVNALPVEPPTDPQPVIVRPVIRKPVNEEPKPTATATAAPTATPAPSLIPSVSITSISPSSPVTGQPITFIINVQPSSGGPIPTGTLEVRANGSYICTATLDLAGNAACVASFSSPGFYDMDAKYLGDVKYLPAQSAVWVEFMVSPADTTTVIVSHAPQPSLVGNTVTFTATVGVNSPGSGTPYGSVTFSDGSVNTCTVTSAPWTCSINFANTGRYTMTATYTNSDGNYYGSVSASVSHDVLPDNNTQFNTPLGPMAAMLGAANCTQYYGVDALDVDGLSQVELEYSLNDNTFASPTRMALTKINDYTWERSTSIPATYPDVIFWRFVATDGASNQFYFGNGVPYATGTDAYYFYLDIGVTCP